MPYFGCSINKEDFLFDLGSVMNNYKFARLKIINLIAMAYKIDPDLCTACGSCVDECPVDAISEGDVYVINADLCTDCGACAEVCPVEAIFPE